MKPEIAWMIEGQNGLNRTRWRRIARSAEELGFAELFRFDPFTNAEPPDRETREAGIQRGMLRWLEPDDPEGPERLARAFLGE
jgi:hypothetical protein